MEPDAVLSSALPQPPDPTVYTARDLDSYPKPLTPLNFDRLADRDAVLAPPEVRLELLIDELGIVGEVAFDGPRLPGSLATQLRAVVTSTRFVPARRNGRAVRSRVMLSVNLQERRGP